MATTAQTTKTIHDGEVLEANAPRKLAQTWRVLMDPGLAAEGFTQSGPEKG